MTASPMAVPLAVPPTEPAVAVPALRRAGTVAVRAYEVPTGTLAKL